MQRIERVIENGGVSSHKKKVCDNFSTNSNNTVSPAKITICDTVKYEKRASNKKFNPNDKNNKDSSAKASGLSSSNYRQESAKPRVSRNAIDNAYSSKGTLKVSNEALVHKRSY